MNKLKEQIREYIKRVLGITKLEEELTFFKGNYEKVLTRFFQQERIIEEMMKDNRMIINQIKLINQDFSVAADINNKYETSVVLVMRKFKGKENVIKTYHFQDETVERIYSFLEGFGEDNVRIDSYNRRFPKPRFRY